MGQYRLDDTHYITNIDIDDMPGAGKMIVFDLITPRGTARRLGEYVRGDGRVERGGNIEYNCMDVLTMLFDMSGKPGLMPDADWLFSETPAARIYDALDEALRHAAA